MLKRFMLAVLALILAAPLAAQPYSDVGHALYAQGFHRTTWIAHPGKTVAYGTFDPSQPVGDARYGAGWMDRNGEWGGEAVTDYIIEAYIQQPSNPLNLVGNTTYRIVHQGQDWIDMATVFVRVASNGDPQPYYYAVVVPWCASVNCTGQPVPGPSATPSPSPTPVPSACLSGICNAQCPMNCAPPPGPSPHPSPSPSPSPSPVACPPPPPYPPCPPCAGATPCPAPPKVKQCNPVPQWVLAYVARIVGNAGRNQIADARKLQAWAAGEAAYCGTANP